MPAKWMKDGIEVIPSDKVVIEAKGKVHKLTLKDTTLDDRAEYTICVKDRTSTAPLFVEGIGFNLFLTSIVLYEMCPGNFEFD